MNTRQIGIFATVFALLAFVHQVQAATSKSYVQDGLVAHWDAIDNIGVGQHSSTTNRWIDLTTNHFHWALNTANVTWTEKGLYLKGAAGASNVRSDAPTFFAKAPIKTIEFVYANAASQDGIIFTPGLGSSAYLYTDKYNRVGYYNSRGHTVALNSTNTFSVLYSPAANASPKTTCWLNGVKQTTVETMGNWWTANMGYTYLGGRNGATPYAKGTIFAIRVYNRELTDAERERNHKVDGGRFFGLPLEDEMEIASNPANVDFGEMNPPCGLVSDLVGGDSFTCSVPVAMTNEAKTITAVCKGWKLYDDSGAVKDSGTGNAMTYVHPNPEAHRKLVWQWEAEYKVTATSAAGAVTNTLQWVKAGETFNTLFVPDPGVTDYKFTAWKNQKGAVVGADVALSLVITEPTDLTADIRLTRYVSTTGSDENAGTSWDAPFLTVQKGIDAAGEEGLVLVAAGDYPTTSTLMLTNGVSLLGCGTTNTAVTLRNTTSADKTKNVLKIQDSSHSVVTNLSIVGGWGTLGSAVEMDSGLIVDCVIRDNLTVNLTDDGGGVNMSGGTVRRCDIYNCEAQDSGGGSRWGGGVYMTRGTVEFCRIRNCKRQVSWGTGGCGGGVYLDGGGTLRNCLIAGCKAYKNGSGVCAVGGTVENCTIVGNTQNDSDAGATGLYAQGTVLRNNIIWGNTKYDGVTVADLSCSGLSEANVYNNNSSTAISVGSNNIAVDPQFVDASNGDYRLGYSDCVNGGSNQTWMAAATDLDGKARIIDRIVDIGCYERAASTGLECKFTVTTETTLDKATVTVNADVSGDVEGLVCYWTFTRRLDNAVVRLVGDEYRGYFTYDFGPGVWDARLDVTNGASFSAFSKVEKAIDVRASVVYVSQEGKAVCPYATLENATASVDDGFALLGEGGVLYVDEGNYTISSQILLSSGKGSKIISLKGPEKTSIRLAQVSAFTSGGYWGFVLSKSGAVLAGLTIAGGRIGPQYSGNAYNTYGLVTMSHSGATMTNCVLRDAWAATYGSDSQGMGLRITGGNVFDCTFQNIEAHGSSGSGLTGGTINGSGTFDRVVVRGCFNSNPSSTDQKGDIVYLTGGSMRNSLITGCTTRKTAPVGINGASFVNCTVVANTNNAAAYYETSGGIKYYCNNHTAGIRVYSGTAKNCIVAKNWSKTPNCISNLTGAVTYTLVDGAETHAGEGNKTADPKFFMREGKKWRIKSDSPAFDAAQSEDWMTDTAIDLDHNPRIRHRAPDMGCYEGERKPFMLLVR